MGECIYCKKPAGFLRSRHVQCEKQYQKRQVEIAAGRTKIMIEVQNALSTSSALDDLNKCVTDIQNSLGLAPEDMRSMLVKGWENTVDLFLDDGVLDRSEENRLVAFKEYFQLSQSELDQHGSLTKTAKAAVLRDLLNGIFPARITVDGSLPVNFQKGEKIAWAFKGAQYLEDKTRRQFVGGTQGVSVRVMKGVYYRVGGFKAHPVDITERTYVDSGWVILTNKNVYFAGTQKSIRLPYSKIISFEPFSDGFGVIRDAATAKPQVFVTGDGWFSYNLLVNLAKLGNNDS